MKRLIVPVLILAFSLGLMTQYAEPAPGSQRAKNEPQEKPQERVIIPKEIQAIMAEGLPSREGRQDIPFTLSESVILWAQNNLIFPTFYFKAKNADLGFVATDPTAAALQARVEVFLQFYQSDATGSLNLLRETYVPVMLQEDSAGYDPEKVEWYSWSYVLPPGHYTIAMAMTSPDLSKVGVDYYDIILPGPADYEGSLYIPPIYYYKSVEQMQAPDNRLSIQKDKFNYGMLQMAPNLERIVAPGEQIEIFYFVFGATPVDETGTVPKYNLEIAYELQDGEGNTAVKWEAMSTDSFMVMQPLPLKVTVMIKDDEGERTEQRDLEPGKYQLLVQVMDNTSGATAQQKVALEVK